MGCARAGAGVLLVGVVVVGASRIRAVCPPSPVSPCGAGAVKAVYALSSLDTEEPLRPHTKALRLPKSRVYAIYPVVMLFMQ